jgi:predicted nucleotidyltransferase
VNYGLTDRDFAQILAALRQFPQIEESLIFGSRAKGNYKPGSDVDLAVKGKNITYRDVIRLSTRLNEDLPLPYFFDVVHYEALDNPALIAHIDRVGKIIYAASKMSQAI